jgi:hypothetical protein
MEHIELSGARQPLLLLGAAEEESDAGVGPAVGRTEAPEMIDAHPPLRA